MLELYETAKQKRKKGLLEKLILTGGKLAGGGIGSVAGSVAGAAYAVSKEIYSLVITQQLYPLQSLALEYLSVVGILSLGGTLTGYYLTHKFLDIFTSSEKRR
jgi:hypothetical protein